MSNTKRVILASINGSVKHWVEQQLGEAVTHTCTGMYAGDIEALSAGDIVIGKLDLDLVAALSASGVEYHHIATGVVKFDLNSKINMELFESVAKLQRFVAIAL